MSAKGTIPKYWTEKDLEYLKSRYPVCKSIKSLAKKLGRSESVIYTKATRELRLSRRGLPAYNRVVFSKAELSFIRKNFDTMTNPQIAKHLGKKLTVVRNQCRVMGLLHMVQEYWTPEQVEFLKANYSTMGNVVMAEYFEKRWPKKKQWTLKHIEKKMMYLGLKRTLEEQFLIRTNRFNASDYKDFDGKQFPQGKKRLWSSNGKFRWMIKVGDSFVNLARHNWEKKRGPIPKGYKLRFKDGNTAHWQLKNMELVSLSDLARKVSLKNHKQLSDSYIAGILSWRDPEMKKQIMNHPGIIEAKRKQILNNRKMGLSRASKSVINSNL